MVQDKDAQVLIMLLSAVLNGEQAELGDDEKIHWERVLEIARSHSVAGMACYAINELPKETQPEEDIMAEFRYAKLVGVLREEVQQVIMNSFFKKLEAKKVRVLPLKGYVIKSAYPAADMRVIGGVNILVDDENTGEVKKILTSYGFSWKSSGGSFDVYATRKHMKVVVHHKIILDDFKEEDYFISIFERAHPVKGHRYLYEMTPEDFYLYNLAHMAKYYVYGGTGIHAIMDLFVCKHQFIKNANWEYIKKELKKIGLYYFEAHLTQLSAVWFASEESDSVTQDVAAFILKKSTFF